MKLPLCSKNFKTIHNLKFISLAVLFLLSICTASGQGLSQEVTESNLNIPYLEHLVKVKIDSVRKSFNLKPLINDEILLTAATSHSTYLVKYDKFSHYETGIPEMETPQKRAEFHGAKNYSVGENIVKVPLGVMTTVKNNGLKPTKTYAQVAQVMMLGWVNSPGHFANIKTADFDITGVSMMYDKKHKDLICVQKFAMVNEFYLPQENKALFPYAQKVDVELIKGFAKALPKKHKKHAYGVKETKKEKYCEGCNFNVFKRDNIVVGVAGDSLVLSVLNRNLRAFKQFFTERKDGISIEFVMFKNTYLCYPADNVQVPTRRNGRCEFDGIITEPLYKKSLIAKLEAVEKRNKEKRIRLDKDDYLEIKIAKFPDAAKNEKIAVNFLAFKSNRLCYVSEGRQICGVPMVNDLFKLPYRDQLKPGVFNPKIKPKLLKFRLNFDRNETDYKSEKMMELVKRLKATKNIITHVSIDAFASVEGTTDINERLFQKRAEGVVAFFESYQKEKIKFKLITNENWQLFFDQLKGSDFEYLLDLDTSEIRSFVNKKENRFKLQDLLKKQRYAFIKLQITPLVTEDDLLEKAVDNFLKIPSKGSSASGAKVKKLIDLQQFIYGKMKEYNVPSDSISLHIPLKPAFVQLLFNELMFEQKEVGSKLSHYQFYGRLYDIDALGHANELITYNLLSYLFNRGMPVEDRISSLTSLIKMMNKFDVGQDTIYNYELHLTHLKVNEYVQVRRGSLKDFKKNRMAIHHHYDSLLHGFDDEFKFTLAKYHIYWVLCQGSTNITRFSGE